MGMSRGPIPNHCMCSKNESVNIICKDSINDASSIQVRQLGFSPPGAVRHSKPNASTTAFTAVISLAGERLIFFPLFHSGLLGPSNMKMGRIGYFRREQQRKKMRRTSGFSPPLNTQRGRAERNIDSQAEAPRWRGQ